MKVLIVDDHRLFLDGIKSLMRQWRRDVELREAGTLAEACAAIQRLGPVDLILLDLTLPDSLDPSSTAHVILEAARGTPVIAVTMLDDPALMARVAQFGARGYVRKSDSAAVMLATFDVVLAGGSCIPTRAAQDARGTTTDQPALSGRQLEVLELIAEGLSNKEIARRLDIAHSTVKVHVHRILQELGTTSRGKAAAIARSAMAPSINC